MRPVLLSMRELSSLSPMEPLEVMIVDDDPSIRMTLGRWLQKSCGTDASEYVDGVEALNRLNAESADLMLLDESMPNLSGLELLEIVRGDPELRHLEVVMVSAAGHRDQIEKALALGVSDYLVKPLSFQGSESRLRAAVDRAKKLQRRRRRQARPEQPKVLIAAPDARTRELAEEALGEHFECQSVSTLGGLFVAAFRYRPALAVVADSLPGFRPELAVAKLEAAARTMRPAVVLLSEKPTPEKNEARAPIGLPRYPQPDALRACVQKALKHGGVDPGDPATWVERLEPQFANAVMESFSVMLGREVRPAATDRLTGPTRSWSIELRPPLDGCVLRGTFHAVDGVGQAAAMDMLGIDESELDAEVVDSCMSEALNVFGGRLKATASELLVDLRMGLPEREHELGPADYEWRRVFHWDDTLSFQASVQAYRRPAETAEAAST